MQSLYPLPQVISPTTLPTHHNMSSPIETYATIYNIPTNASEDPIRSEFAASTTTLVNPPTVPLPRTPTPEPVRTPTERPHLTLAPDSDMEEGEIVSRVHHHNYPLSPQSSLNIMQGHLELEAGTLRTIAIGLANTAIGRTFQHLEAKAEVEQLRKELTDLHTEMSCQPDSECPNGFEENRRCLPDFTIPDNEGVMHQARYVKLGNGPVPFALRTLGREGDPVFQYDLFAAPSYLRNSPTEPLPTSAKCKST